MSEIPEPTSSLAPELHPDDRVRFVANHRPPLDSGDYVITATHELHVNESDVRVSETERHFSVAGPRFELNPSIVHSVYPPPRSRGRFSDSLAHVILDRTTLPWERSSAIASEDERHPPWLAVVVFDAAKLAQVASKQNLTLQELRDDTSVIMGEIPPESTDDPSTQIATLDVPWSTLKTALPGPDDVSWLCHVRDVVGPDHEDSNRDHMPKTESATVMSLHAPPPGVRVEAHLVSLEGWFRHDGDTLVRHLEPSDADTVRLVSLYTWDFFCAENATRSFADLTAGLGDSVDLLRLPPIDGAAAEYLANGFVALPHQFRQGDQSYSWYHGPLAPGPPSNETEQPVSERLPAFSADELAVFDADASIFDVSHASAWELGRMLALKDPSVGVELAHWRAARRHADRRRSVINAHQHLAHAMPEPHHPDFPLTHWFVTALDRLSAVPFRYLVPDDSMLPREALRFFTVDPNWQRCLRDGAFSIGRAGRDDQARLQERNLLDGLLPPAPAMHGLLLRSDLVADYPGLMVEARNDEALVPAVRIDHLSPRVLIVLYDAPITEVQLHLHPQVMHFNKPEPDLAAAVGSSEHSGDFAFRHLAKTPLQVFRRQV